MTMENRVFDNAAFPKLRDKEAIDALREYIHELQEQKGKELTEKQTYALIRFTCGLISYIKTEKQRIKSDKELRARRLEENETKNDRLRWLNYVFTI
jgi:hypothetical protein